MKTPILYYFSIAAVAMGLTFSGCASSGSATNSGGGSDNATTVQVDDPAVDLTDYLRQFPSIVVSGNGPNANITIRGVSTLSSTAGSSPLFILDGVRIGRNFASLYDRVRMNEVREVRVLRGVEASMYGSEGANGVIVVNRIR